MQLNNCVSGVALQQGSVDHRDVVFVRSLRRAQEDVFIAQKREKPPSDRALCCPQPGASLGSTGALGVRGHVKVPT